MVLNLILSLENQLPGYLEDKVELGFEVALLHLLYYLKVSFVALHLYQWRKC